MKFNFLLVAVFSFFIFSCGDNEDTQTLIGSWQLQSITTNGCTSADENFSLDLDDDGCATVEGISLCLLWVFQFNANETLSFDASIEVPGFDELEIGVDDLDLEIGDLGDFETNATWMQLNDNTISICSDGECSNVSYRINGDLLTLEGFDADEDCNTTIVLKKQ